MACCHESISTSPPRPSLPRRFWGSAQDEVSRETSYLQTPSQAPRAPVQNGRSTKGSRCGRRRGRGHILVSAFHTHNPSPPPCNLFIRTLRDANFSSTQTGPVKIQSSGSQCFWLEKNSNNPKTVPEVRIPVCQTEQHVKKSLDASLPMSGFLTSSSQLLIFWSNEPEGNDTAVPLSCKALGFFHWEFWLLGYTHVTLNSVKIRRCNPPAEGCAAVWDVELCCSSLGCGDQKPSAFFLSICFWALGRGRNQKTHRPCEKRIGKFVLLPLTLRCRCVRAFHNQSAPCE